MIWDYRQIRQQAPNKCGPVLLQHESTGATRGGKGNKSYLIISTLIINPGYWLVTLTIFFGRTARSTPLLDGWILKPEPLDAWLNSQRNLVQAESQGRDFLLNWVPHKAFESYVKDSEIKDSARKCLVAKRTRGFPMRPGAVVEAVKSTCLSIHGIDIYGPIRHAKSLHCMARQKAHPTFFAPHSMLICKYI